MYIDTRTLLSRLNLERIAVAEGMVEPEDLPGGDVIGQLRNDLSIGAGSEKYNFTIDYCNRNQVMAKRVVQAVLNLLVENTRGETRLEEPGLKPVCAD